MSCKPVILFFALSIGLGIQQAQACASNLKGVQSNYLESDQDLCALSDRYRKALEELEKQGVQPAERIANLHAARMINYPTWLKLREEKNYNPWLIYTPVPQTWQSWENGARILDALTTENLKNQKIRKFDFAILQKIHATSLTGLIGSAGKWRHHPEVGLSLAKTSAITLSQAKALQGSEYPSQLQPGTNMLSWKTTGCFENRSEEFRQQHIEHYEKTRQVDLSKWSELDPDSFFLDEQGTPRQCGYIVYADPQEVSLQMQAWLEYLNAATESWNQNKKYQDPLLVAARVQRWFITIHPFEDGNGRLSRFVMEYVLRSLGLPSPLIQNFNNDLYYSEEQWAREIGDGLLRSVKIAELCAKNISSKGCQVVSEVP